MNSTALMQVRGVAGRRLKGGEKYGIPRTLTVHGISRGAATRAKVVVLSAHCHSHSPEGAQSVTVVPAAAAAADYLPVQTAAAAAAASSAGLPVQTRAAAAAAEATGVSQSVGARALTHLKADFETGKRAFLVRLRAGIERWITLSEGFWKRYGQPNTAIEGEHRIHSTCMTLFWQGASGAYHCAVLQEAEDVRAVTVGLEAERARPFVRERRQARRHSLPGFKLTRDAGAQAVALVQHAHLGHRVVGLGGGGKKTKKKHPFVSRRVIVVITDAECLRVREAGGFSGVVVERR